MREQQDYTLMTGERSQENQAENANSFNAGDAKINNGGSKSRQAQEARAAIMETKSDIHAEAKEQYMDIEDEQLVVENQSVL